MAGRADLGRVQGIDGVGVVAGGTTGQALVKSSNTDYDTEWASVTVTVNNKSPDLNGNTAVDGTDINVDDDEATPQTRVLTSRLPQETGSYGIRLLLTG